MTKFPDVQGKIKRFILILSSGLNASGSDDWHWQIYTADPDGGFGVGPRNFEIWEYPTGDLGGGGCCRRRFVIESTYGTSNSPLNLYLAGNGNVGIGTTSPAQKLDVNGNIKMNDKLYFGNWLLGASGAWTSGPGFQYSGGDATFGFSSTGGQVSIQIDGGFRQQETGKVNYFMDNVGIDMTSPSAKLDVNGTAEINGQLDMQSNKIVDLADPTDDQDAATKNYVDNLAGNGAPKASSTHYKIYRPFHP